MSCSELGKEYICHEAHFKLPYENIPESEQDGITKKSGGESRFNAYPDSPRKKINKNPMWIKSMHTFKYNLEDTDYTRFCSQTSRRAIPAALQHLGAGHHSKNFHLCNSQAPVSLRVVMASASSFHYWQLNVNLLGQRGAYTPNKHYRTWAAPGWVTSLSHASTEIKFQCDNNWTLPFQQDNQGKAAQVPKILHF